MVTSNISNAENAGIPVGQTPSLFEYPPIPLAAGHNIRVPCISRRSRATRATSLIDLSLPARYVVDGHRTPPWTIEIDWTEAKLCRSGFSWKHRCPRRWDAGSQITDAVVSFVEC